MKLLIRIRKLSKFIHYFRLKVTKDYVAEKAVITFPANVVMQYKERFRERITAYINLLTAKLKEIGQLVM